MALGLKALDVAQTEVELAASALADSPGGKTIGFLCGHGELCPFATSTRAFPKEFVEACQQEPFMKKAVEDITGLEDRLSQHNEAIGEYFRSRGYRTQRVEGGKPIALGIDALVIYGPRKAIKDFELYDLDQFILTGKPVVFLVNNYLVEVDQWSESPPYELSSRVTTVDTNLDSLLAHYRVQNQKNLVMETEERLQENINTITIQDSSIGPIPVAAKYRYALFPVFETFNRVDPLVAARHRAVLPFASSFTDSRAGQPGLEYHALISSSAKATATSSDVIIDPKVLRDTVVRSEPSAGPYDVAVRVTGVASSYFAGRSPPERPKEDTPKVEIGRKRPTAPEPEEVAQTDKGPVNIVVIGSNLGLEDLSADRLLDGLSLGAIAQDRITGLTAAVPYYVRYANAWGRFVGQQNPVHLGERGKVTQLPGQQADFWQENVDFLSDVFASVTHAQDLQGVSARAEADASAPVTLTDTSVAAAKSLAGTTVRFYRSASLPDRLAVLGRPGRGLIEGVAKLTASAEALLTAYSHASGDQITWSSVTNELDRVATSQGLEALEDPDHPLPTSEPEVGGPPYYLALSFQFRGERIVVPVLRDRATLEYVITGALLRLRAKEADATAQRDVLDAGMALAQGVRRCQAAITQAVVGQGGGLGEGPSTLASIGAETPASETPPAERLTAVEDACVPVEKLLASARLVSAATRTGDRRGSVAFLDRLLSRAEWYDAYYGAWVARVVGEAWDVSYLERLLTLVGHPAGLTRVVAIQVLGVLAGGDGVEAGPALGGPALEASLGAIDGRVQDVDPIVRAVALQSLAVANSERASPQIAHAVSDPVASVRSVALDLALRFKVTVEQSALTPLLKDDDWRMRRMALAYLIEQKSAAPRVIRPMLDDVNQEVRFLAAYGLALAKDRPSLGKVKTFMEALPAGQARDALEAAVKDMGAK